MAMASWNYEGSAPIRAFTSKRAAQGFVARCLEHHAKKPACPRLYEDTPEGNAEFAALDRAEEAWRKRHPAKGHESCDGFTILSIKLCE